MSHSPVVQEVMKRANAPGGEQFVAELEEFLREKGAAEKRASQASHDSAREQFFNAIYARDVELLTLLLTGSRRQFVHANMLSATDSWTPLHACLYKYNQFPPMATIRIVKLLLEHGADVNRPCPTGAIAISVTDKKQPRRNGSEPTERESRLVRFQNKTALEVAIDFLQSYKWAGCRPALLERWTPLIHLLDEASQKASQQKSKQEQNNFYHMPEIELEQVPIAFRRKFCRLFEEQIGCDCTLYCVPSQSSPNQELSIATRQSSLSRPKDEQKCLGLDQEDDDDPDQDSDHSISAHKCILMASSPVFERMFSNQMRESLDGRIEIRDVPFEVLKIVVRFMYFHRLELPSPPSCSSTSEQVVSPASSSSSSRRIPQPPTGVAPPPPLAQNSVMSGPPPLSTIPPEHDSPFRGMGGMSANGSATSVLSADETESKVNGDGTAVVVGNNGIVDARLELNRDEKLRLLLPLLQAADKYSMHDLKHMVEWELQPLLAVETVIPIFLSAHRYRAKNLGEICVRFVCENFQIVHATEDYQQLKEYPDLMAQILERSMVGRSVNPGSWS